ncbi:hypothetical protein QBC40DRAFT_316283 [Triangularia verruculosa]|uniref:LCCL domain-containing protein n=1 Tax=Triangularia verruculosa TaxID=2587418 RepID=A0AAN7AXT2_9PEZI|nr:hypothetical protein QBC40DRAFT_316283 [Triangularia verruculosa]
MTGAGGGKELDVERGVLSDNKNNNNNNNNGGGGGGGGERKDEDGVQIRHVDDDDDNDEHGSDEEAQLLGGGDGNSEEGLEMGELATAAPESDVENHVVKSRQKKARKRGGYCGWVWGPERGGRMQRIRAVGWLLPGLQGSLVDGLGHVFRTRVSRGLLLGVFLTVWGLSILVPVVLTKGGLVVDGEEVKHMSCVSSLWKPNAECGIDGGLCEPFGNLTVPFRCPAGCAGVRVLNPRRVGGQEVNYRAWVVGGGEGVYRGDSFVCQAGIHAGVLTDGRGGCGRVRLRGEYYRFENTTGNGVEGIQFGSYFPMSYEIEKVDKCGRGDMRWGQLVVSVVLSVILGIATTSAKVVFFGVFAGVFMHVGLVSDPPDIEVMSGRLVQELVGMMVGRLLPGVFVMVVVYWVIARKTLEGLEKGVNWEKTGLWVGGVWLGALDNITFDAWIPINRLEGHDLRQQPGAVVALVIVVAVLVMLAGLQAYHFWQEGSLPRYLGFYGVVIGAIGALVALPGLELRLHHYILALLLLPGTALQTRPSLLFQGILIGLFINGVARWGFDSVLQTYDSIRGDGQYGSILPEVVAPFIETLEMGVKQETIHFKWSSLDDMLRLREKIEGISVLVNDVERFRGWFAETRLEDLVFSWPRFRKADEYFRFAFVREGGSTLDWTEAGTWFVNGTWSKGVGYYRG